jgi:hypothetical protein
MPEDLAVSILTAVGTSDIIWYQIIAMDDCER